MKKKEIEDFKKDLKDISYSIQVIKMHNDYLIKK
jgi:hypothetical protein